MMRIMRGCMVLGLVGVFSSGEGMLRVMAVPGKYGVGLRWRVMRMVLGAGRDPESSRGVRRVVDRLGVRLEVLRAWVRQAEIDDGVRPGTMSGDTTRVAESGREAR